MGKILSQASDRNDFKKTTLLKHWGIRASPADQSGVEWRANRELSGCYYRAQIKERAGKPALSDHATKLTESD